MYVFPKQGRGRSDGDPWQVSPYPVSPLVVTDFTPVRGVSLDLFAGIARTLAASCDSQVQGTELAAAKGVAAEDWLFACRVWNTRIAENPAVARVLSERFRAEGREALAS
jgi:hypothetical protein